MASVRIFTGSTGWFLQSKAEIKINERSNRFVFLIIFSNNFCSIDVCVTRDILWIIRVETALTSMNARINCLVSMEVAPMRMVPINVNVLAIWNSFPLELVVWITELADAT